MWVDNGTDKTDKTPAALSYPAGQAHRPLPLHPPRLGQPHRLGSNSYIDSISRREDCAGVNRELLMATKQRTFSVGDHKIQIKSRPKLWKGNPNGYAVDINGESYHVNALPREDAEGHAYGRWVKANVGDGI